jgi:hypothetical protein
MISPHPNSPQPRRLAGKPVFLSASVPSKERSKDYQRVTDTAVSVEEAVIAVARAVFAAGGELVFGAHPSISPLVASVLGEYYVPEAPAPAAEGGSSPRREGQGQPRVVMYQSKVWEPLWAESSLRLAEHPRVEVHWTSVIDKEAVSPTPSAAPQAPHSMKEMRTQMIEQTRPVAMIAIGGMEGTEEEVELFARLREGRPIYVLATTGGAAGLIAKRPKIHRSRVVVMDEKSRDAVMQFWTEQENRDPRRSKDQSVGEGSAPSALREQHYYVPYSFVAQQIIAEIAERNE